MCEVRIPAQCEGHSASSSSSSSDNVSTGSDEDDADVCEVGLHAVFKRGDVLGGTHRIEGVLGRGQFSTVYLCDDGKRQAAMKIYRAPPHVQAFAQDEVKLLETVNLHSRDHASLIAGQLCIVRLMGSFVHEGVHCSHPCLILQLFGPTVLDLAQQCQGDQLPLSLLRSVARDAICGLDFLHRACSIIHTDIKPENILASLGEIQEPVAKRSRVDDASASAAISCSRWRQSHARRLIRSGLSENMGTSLTFALTDLGNSCFTDAHVSDFIQTCEYKAPEVLLGAGYDCSTDLWSLACTLFECATGRYLLDPRCTKARPGNICNISRHGCSLEEEHIAQIVELVGTIPDEILLRGKLTQELLSKSDETKWKLRNVDIHLADLHQCSLQDRLHEYLTDRAVDEVQSLLKLLTPMLAIEPSLRPKAGDLFKNSPWICRESEPMYLQEPRRRSRWGTCD